jgi:hypothetical protein
VFRKGPAVAEPKPKDDERPDERNSAFERFEDLAKRLLKVPKEELDEEREKREHEKKQAG